MIKNDTKQKQKSRSDESAKQEVFVSEKRSKQKQGTAEPAFGFERAYTKQKRKSRSDEPAKQEVFVSEKGTKEKTIWYLSRFAGNNTGVLL